MKKTGNVCILVVAGLDEAAAIAAAVRLKAWGNYSAIVRGWALTDPVSAGAIHVTEDDAEACRRHFSGLIDVFTADEVMRDNGGARA